MLAQLTEGALFAGRYRLIRRIAVGGMGVVYEAVHAETERRRALKVMHAHLFQSDEMCDRFKREARIAAHVESEHIVDVSDAGVDEITKMPFMVMELLRGEDLRERLKRLGRRPQAEVVMHLRQMASALDKTHASGIIHRDLKPQNLFLTHREDGTPRLKILDFGIAKVVRDGVTAAEATQGFGTPTYMAPEQFRFTRLTPAVDIYALGMLAYTLLVGRAYWSKEAKASPDVLALSLAVMQGPREPATARAAMVGVTLSPRFDPWFAKVTAFHPAYRFQTATEAVDMLVDALGAESIASATAPFIVSSPKVVMAEGPTVTSSEVTLVRTKPSHWHFPLSLIPPLGIAAATCTVWLGLRAPSEGAAGAAVEAAASALIPLDGEIMAAPTPKADITPPIDPTGATPSATAVSTNGGAVITPVAPPSSSASVAARPLPPKPKVAPVATLAPLIGRE